MSSDDEFDCEMMEHKKFDRLRRTSKFALYEQKILAEFKEAVASKSGTGILQINPSLYHVFYVNSVFIWRRGQHLDAPQ